MAQPKILIWSGGLAAAAVIAALVLWSLYGPLVYVNALNAAWTCF